MAVPNLHSPGDRPTPPPITAGPSDPAPAALSAELARLEAENAWLRQQLQAAPVPADPSFLHSLYSSTDLGIVVIDVTPAGEFRFAALNPAYARRIGCSEAQLVGKTLAEASFPQAEAMAQNYRRCWQMATALHCEEATLLQDRLTHWYTTLTPVLDGGTVTRILGTCLEITHLKQVETQLRESEARFMAILDSSPANIYIVVMAADGRVYFEHISRAVETIAGLSVAAVMADARLLFKQIHPDDWAGYQAAVRHSLATLTPFSHQWRIVTPAGEIKWLQGRSQPRRRPNGDTVWYGVVIDITDLKRIEDERRQTDLALRQSLDRLVATQAALQTSEMVLSGVLNSSLDGIVALRACRDEAGHIVDFEGLLINPAACNLLHLSADALVGHSMLTALPGHKTSGIFDCYVQVVETGQPHRQEIYYPYDNIDGWYEVVSVKLGDGVAITFRNITVIKQSKLAIQEANQRLAHQVDLLNLRNAEMQHLGKMIGFLQTCATAEAAYGVLASLLEPLFPDCGGGFLAFSRPGAGAELAEVELAEVELAKAELPLAPIAQWGKTPLPRQALPLSACRALATGDTYWVSPDPAALRCCHLAALPADQSSFCVPVSAQGETLGMLYLHSAKPEALGPAQRQLAKTVAEQLALTLANLHLRQTLRHQSIRDPLTGLYNRRYLEESLTQEMVAAQRRQQPIGVIMLDLDRFKDFNDTYGHGAGDRALQAVAQLLMDSVRGSDIACRYGGEEIILILPGSALGETQRRAEELRRAIAALAQPEGATRLTASLGVSCFPGHGTTLEALLKAADVALYAAKQQGRNRVVVAG